MKKLFLLLSLCCISFAAWADEYTDEKGVTWEYNLNTQWDETTQTNVVTDAVITKCSNYGTEIVVPESIQVDENSYNVVSLDGSVFNDGSDQQGTVTSVTLPSTLKRIGWNVFNSFSSLKSLNIPEGVTSIGGDIFWDCNNLVLTLPSSLQSVESGAFSYCNTVIVPFTDPASLGNNILRDNVFNNVKHIAVPDEAIDTYKSAWTKYAENICGHSEVVEYTYTDNIGVTWTYYYTLSTSSARIVKAEGYDTDIVVPGTLPYNDQQIPVTAIEHSFSDDENIATVDLSNTSITTTPSFSGCTSLTTILFPSTLESISESAFYRCESLQSIDLSTTKVTEIKNGTFGSCSILSSITFPSTLEKIGESAFYANSLLQLIDLSETQIVEIGNEAFNSCHNITTVSIPASLKKIGKGAFEYNGSLSSIDLSHVEEIGNRAFWETHSLNNVDLSSAKVIGSEAFNRDITFTINATEPAKIAFNSFTENSKFIVSPNTYNAFCTAENWNRWADNISTFNIDTNGVKWFYRYLQDSESICIIGASDYGEEITIPSTLPCNGNDITVTTIESFAFNGCYSLTSIKIPASVTTIKNDAFARCTSLSSVIFEENSALQVIGWWAFYGCEELLSIEIPASVTKIENHAFSSCSKLSSITFKENSALQTIEHNVFNSCIALTSIEIPASVTTIEGAAFYNCTNLKTVKIGENSALQAIGDNVFYSCVALTSIEIPASVTKIENHAFSSCSKLSSITFKENSALQTIEHNAFNSCVALTSIEIPASVTTIEESTFWNCISLKTVKIGENSALQAIGDRAFSGNHNLSSINIPASVKTIGIEAFHYCPELKGIDLSNVEVIKEGAFSEVYKLSSIDLSSATSVGANAFSSYEGDEILFTINNENPANIEYGAFPSSAMFLVPGTAATYKSADVWSDYASRIFGREIAVQTINVTAQENGSGVLDVIGSDNQINIVDLTVKGTINGYDFVMFKDKMPNLRFLDLTDAKIVYNPYHYYDGRYYSQDDTLGAYAFHGENKLLSIKLPKNIKYIGENAFSDCSKLTKIELPNTITAIGGSAFRYTGLTEVILPNRLISVGSSAFANTQLKEVRFPTTLTTIEWGAFQGCHQLETVRIPSSLQYISDYAFGECYNLKKVYSYTIEPTNINENTFSNFETATLYYPTASGQNYFWDPGWKRFYNVAEFNEEYEYFYLNNDHTLNKSTGAIDGTPDADLNAGSGLTVEEGVEQEIGDLNIQHNGTNGGSIIAGSEEGNVSVDNLHVNINVESGRWYFFCFPFDLKKENISMGKENTQYIFRWYDGKERAEGKSGWKNVTESEGSYLKAATGYIFQCSQSDVLTISLADVKFKKEKKYNELVASAAKNLQDASWNFVGNPYLSYYDMNSVGYNAPITVWNGETYEAIKPGDDDYHFAPFEAFFVQKPEGTDSIEFDGDAQTTYNGAQAQQQETGARSIRRTDGNRKLVNIILSNGEKSDRTRIVFNDKVSMEYELACDAAKFEAAGVPQLYTIDSRAVKYAINERPVAEGIVTLGYTVPTEGIYTLDAPRMDTQVSVRDNLTRTIHRFDEGSYEFYSEAGTFEGRFTILTNSGATGIENVELDEQHEEIYNLNGQRVNKVTGKGIYIKNNRKEVNM